LNGFKRTILSVIAIIAGAAMSAEGLTVTLYTPRPSQRAFHESDARFRVLACGRRWGKTLACVNEVAHVGLNNPGKLIWWVAPVYSQSVIAEKMLHAGLRRLPGLRRLRGAREILFPNGSRIAFKTAENYDALRGVGLEFLVIDEAAKVPQAAWQEALRPTLSDTGGRAVFISTPAGRNWFYHLWLLGASGENPEYQSWTLPTSDNPFIPAGEIEAARRELPERVFRQEYLAEFLENESSAFGNVDACLTPAGPREARGGDSLSVGIDLAKAADYTVLVAFEARSSTVIGAQRFNRMEWPAQEERIKAFHKRYPGPMLVDSTGLGDPVYDHLRRASLPVKGYKFTAESKTRLIEHLAVEMEAGRVKLPDPVLHREPVWAHLANELRAFEGHMGLAGKMKYSAPEGYHDDCVIALALAVWAARHRHTPRSALINL